MRLAVSLGGDTDTIASITGSMAEAYLGVPQELREECLKRIPEDIKAVLTRFEAVSACLSGK